VSDRGRSHCWRSARRTHGAYKLRVVCVTLLSLEARSRAAVGAQRRGLDRAEHRSTICSRAGHALASDADDDPVTRRTACRCVERTIGTHRCTSVSSITRTSGRRPNRLHAYNDEARTGVNGAAIVA
jgi:hypothetical protein